MQDIRILLEDTGKQNKRWGFIDSRRIRQPTTGDFYSLCPLIQYTNIIISWEILPASPVHPAIQPSTHPSTLRCFPIPATAEKYLRKCICKPYLKMYISTSPHPHISTSLHIMTPNHLGAGILNNILHSYISTFPHP